MKKEKPTSLKKQFWVLKVDNAVLSQCASKRFGWIHPKNFFNEANTKYTGSIPKLLPLHIHWIGAPIHGAANQVQT